MPTFTYTAKDPQGHKFSGTIENALTVSDVRDELQKMGYSLLKANKNRKRKGKSNKVTQAEVVEFTFKLAGMYGAGLGVMHCLEVLQEQAENLQMRDIIADVRERVSSGATLRKGFEPYESIFGTYFLGMVEAGESSGELSNVLQMTAVYLENKMQIRQKVKHAFTYPTVVVCVCMVVVTCMIMFVVPMFSKIYTRMNVSLPGPTQALVFLSVAFHRYWYLIIGTILVLVFGIRQWMKSPNNKLKVDTLKLRVPYFGRLNRLVVVSRFNRTFATLISVGVPVVEAMDVASEVAANAHMSEIVDTLKEKIQAGTAIATAFGSQDIFPSIIIHMADSGEESGKLPEMLIKGSEFVDKDIDRIISSLLVKLEPILTVTMGSLIGTILLAVYLPMIDYMNHLK